MTIRRWHSEAVAAVLRTLGGTACASRVPGGFAVVDADGTAVAAQDFGGELARRLLRMLAVRRGELVSRDTLVAALWPTGHLSIPRRT